MDTRAAHAGLIPDPTEELSRHSIITITTQGFYFFGKSGQCAALKTLPNWQIFLFRIPFMRFPLVFTAAIAVSLLTGCASAPNQPTLVLQTQKSPEQYTDCLVPQLQDRKFTPTMSQVQRHYRVVVTSAVAADNVIEVYKAPSGGRVFLYERRLSASSFTPSSFEQAARHCL